MSDGEAPILLLWEVYSRHFVALKLIPTRIRSGITY